MKSYTHYTPEQNRVMATLIDLGRGKARTAAIKSLAEKWKREPLNVSQAISRLKKLKESGKLTAQLQAPTLPFAAVEDQAQESVIEAKIKRFEIVGDRLRIFF